MDLQQQILISHYFWASFILTGTCAYLQVTILLTNQCYSNAGGGGERVLWTALRDVQRDFSNVICVVYTGDIEATKEQIINKVKVRISIMFPLVAILSIPCRFMIDQFQYFIEPQYTTVCIFNKEIFDRRRQVFVSIRYMPYSRCSLATLTDILDSL